MSQLIKHEQLSIGDVTTISKVFAESGMFADAKSAAQAMTKVLAGQEIGIPPFASMSGIHLIQGKLVMGSGLIASRVKGSGKYDYRVVEHTEKICSIDFFQGGEKIGNSTFSLDDAKKAGTKNLDKFPKNMLFARCISNGVKWYCPDVFAGPVYVPEEMNQPTEDVASETTTAAAGTGIKAEVTAFAATPEEWEQANDLIKGSTLEDNKKAQASNSLTNAKTRAAWDKVVARLREVQIA